MVDVSGPRGGPVNDIKVLNEELKSTVNCSQKKQVIAANKMDIAAEDDYKKFESEMTGMGYKCSDFCGNQ